MEKIGTCKICTINLWAECENGPAIFPCGVKNCPHETAANKLQIVHERSFSSSALAQVLETMS